ncbi:divalent-cation tolerance protein CutA [Sphingobium lactosutens]|uniref:divalent-cation tolerance protein CutA n=1 Tax=Sphingobium lactosutens TaxID=522773 RepID=UPI0015B86853|nr:divalent-cation tolerance protein CutA [Sphingobium lactosutens]NWK94162.1 divalent-cation tolerance protein CutA [Sphingobium lactosutens]
MNEPVVLVYTLFGSAEDAGRIARQLVEERLAACANIGAPCTSIYKWKGAIEEAAETPALFKTSPARSEALQARLAELHDYDLPAIVKVDGKASAAFAGWVGEQVQ